MVFLPGKLFSLLSDACFFLALREVSHIQWSRSIRRSSV
jgi:hypothetical protein